MTWSSPRRRGSDPRLCGDDQRSARTAGLRLLKFRPRTEAELRQRLSRKGVPEGEIQTLLLEFRQKGLVDDVKFARLFVTQSVLSKPIGRRMLRLKLRAKGVPEELAQETVAQETQGQEELETARRLARQRFDRMQGLSRNVIDRRLFGFLSRRGFSGDVVYKVIRELHSAVHSSTNSEHVS